MFVTTNFVYEQLTGILKSGKVTITEPIFCEFNEYLKTLGLDSVLSTYIAKSDIIFENPSCILIYLNTTENFNSNNIKRQDNNWDSKYKYTQDIIGKWQQLLKKHGYQDSITYKTQVHIYDFEQICLVDLTYKCKEQITNKICTAFPESQPQYVFCSSKPAYNIVYNTKIRFDNFKEKGLFDEITKLCHDILRQNDLFGYYIPEKIDIFFRHCEEENISLYGLSRED